MDATMNERMARGAGRSGQITIAATPSPCVSWLPNLLRQFQNEYPGIALKLRDATSDYCLKLLAEGHADFSVIAARASDEKEFDSLPLFDDPFYLVCRKDDPLACIRSFRLKHLRDRRYIEFVGHG